MCNRRKRRQKVKIDMWVCLQMNLSGCDKTVMKNSITGSRFVVSSQKTHTDHFRDRGGEEEVEKEERGGGGREGGEGRRR